MLGAGSVVYPHLREGSLDGQLAREAGSIGVEDARRDPVVTQLIDDQLRFRQVRGGEDALQNFTETMPLTPLSLIPAREPTLKAARLTPMRSVIVPLMPKETVVKDVSGM